MKASGNLARGERLDVTIAAPGSQGILLNPKVVMLDDGKEFRWRVRKMLGLFDAEHGFRVVPEDTGRCRLHCRPSLSGLGEIPPKRASARAGMQQV